MKVLLVEDDPEAGAYVAKGLREAGYVVEHVKDGRDALYLATKRGTKNRNKTTCRMNA